MLSSPYIDFDRGLGKATSVNVACLRFSPTQACVFGNYAVNDLPLSLSCGINSCTIYSCQFNLVDLIVLEDKLIVGQLALLGWLWAVLSSVWSAFVYLVQQMHSLAKPLKCQRPSLDRGQLYWCVVAYST